MLCSKWQCPERDTIVCELKKRNVNVLIIKTRHCFGPPLNHNWGDGDVHKIGIKVKLIYLLSTLLSIMWSAFIHCIINPIHQFMSLAYPTNLALCNVLTAVGKTTCHSHSVVTNFNLHTLMTDGCKPLLQFLDYYAIIGSINN